MATPKRVVILGGGFAGAHVAHALDKLTSELKVTLVDPKDYYEVRPTMLFSDGTGPR